MERVDLISWPEKEVSLLLLHLYIVYQWYIYFVNLNNMYVYTYGISVSFVKTSVCAGWFLI